jgi:hypothetical protein
MVPVPQKKIVYSEVFHNFDNGNQSEAGLRKPEG